MTLKASLRSELLKMRRTSLLYLVLIAASVIPVIMVFDHSTPADGVQVNGWDHYYKEGFMAMCFAFLPLSFVLVSTLLMQIEVRNNTWKQVLASPQSFFHVLLSKFIIVQLLAIAFIVSFNVYMALGAAILDAIDGLHLIGYIERWQEVWSVNVMAFGSTIGVSGLCFWIALRSKNFIAPIGIGFLLWFIGPMAAFELKWPYMDWYVFVIPFTVISKRYGDEPVFHQLLSIGYGVFFFSVAYLEFLFKRVSISKYFRRRVARPKGVVRLVEEEDLRA